MAKKLWGGRFSKKTDPLVEEFTRSIHYDHKIAQYDLLGSMAHVQILKKVGHLTPEEASKLDKALDSIYEDVKKGTFFESNDKDEDVHTKIQNILQEKVGDLALKLHTARSRNDQVVFATKLYCKMTIGKLCVDIIKLGNTISRLAEENKDIIIPGFTHMQHAQPVYLKDYLLAYKEMLERDKERLLYIDKNMNIFMGAGALAGTPIDADIYSEKATEFLEEQRDFEKAFKVKTTINSLDVVSDRDFVIEVISALSIIAMHLSRFSEDLIIWSTKEFDFIEIDESFCTGSSLMPQKKNPDVLELIRGYAGRLIGNLVSVLTMMKGLPLTYNRDMQLDKEPLFNSFEIIFSEVNVLTGLIKTLKFNESIIEKHLNDESLYATDLVNYLVDKKIPFKEAHDTIGKLVSDSIDNKSLKGIFKNFLRERFPKEDIKEEEINELFTAKHSVESKISIKRKLK